jgi:hypothetical protein
LLLFTSELGGFLASSSTNFVPEKHLPRSGDTIRARAENDHSDAKNVVDDSPPSDLWPVAGDGNGSSLPTAGSSAGQRDKRAQVNCSTHYAHINEWTGRNGNNLRQVLNALHVAEILSLSAEKKRSYPIWTDQG